MRVLLIDDDAERAEAVRAGLADSGFVVVAVLDSLGDLTRRVREAAADVIVCDIDDPSRDALESMGALYRDEPRPVVVFAGKGEPAQIEAALEAGVAAYVVEGLNPARVRTVLDVAIRRFHAHQRLRAELDAARASIAERVVLDKAKLKLMRAMGLTEDSAHRRLRRMAMDRGLKIAAMADEILRAK